MTDRVISIDIIRGIAISLMILGHVYMFWTKRYDNLFGFLLIRIVIMGSGFFILIAGIGFYISVKRRIDKEIPKLEIFFENLKRATFLFVVSALFQILFGRILNMEITLIFFIFYWNVFQLMAISIILFFVIPFLKSTLRIIAYSILFFIVFLFGHIIMFYEIELLYMLVQGGPFPLFPWASYFIFGMAFGDLLMNKSKEQLQDNLYLFILLGTLILIIYFVWTWSIRYLYIEDYFKTLGVFFILFSIFYYITDIKQKDSSAQRIIIRWGEFSFSLYYIHWGIIAMGSFIFTLFFYEWFSSGMLEYQYILLAILFFIIIETILRIWEKFDYKYCLEYFLSKFSKTSIFIKKNRENSQKVN